MIINGLFTGHGVKLNTKYHSASCFGLLSSTSECELIQVWMMYVYSNQYYPRQNSIYSDQNYMLCCVFYMVLLLLLIWMIFFVECMYGGIAPQRRCASTPTYGTNTNCVSQDDSCIVSTEILYVLSWVAKDQDKDQDQIWRGWVAELTFTLFALQIPAIMYAEEQSGWLPTIITTSTTSYTQGSY